jgi:hypothetical protein
VCEESTHQSSDRQFEMMVILKKGLHFRMKDDADAFFASPCDRAKCRLSATLQLSRSSELHTQLIKEVRNEKDDYLKVGFTPGEPIYTSQ